MNSNNNLKDESLNESFSERKITELKKRIEELKLKGN
jgi:hypothetical protein